MQPSEGEEELGAVVANFDPGGGGSEGVRTFFQCSDIGSVVVSGRDIVTNPQDGASPD